MPFRPNIQVLRDAAQASDAPHLMSGKAVAAALRSEVRRAVELLAERDIHPKLAVVLVGEDPASQIYVRHKVRACVETGIESEKHVLPADTSQQELFALIDRLREDESVYGILVQTPLPGHIDEAEVVRRLPPQKDVDGFTIPNLGSLMAWRGALEPCTPRGVMTLLDAYGVELRGKRACVVGRSMVVGRPMAQMLVRADATVTICHRFTRDLAAHVAEAEVLVVATGVPELVKGEWVREGAVVVDVGITRLPSGKLRGDVEFDTAVTKAHLITPVPGGVGPMTVASLLENTIHATCKRHHLIIEDEKIRPLA